jgi:hypothetical protein
MCVCVCVTPVQRKVGRPIAYEGVDPKPECKAIVSLELDSLENPKFPSDFWARYYMRIKIKTQSWADELYKGPPIHGQ